MLSDEEREKLIVFYHNDKSNVKNKQQDDMITEATTTRQQSPIANNASLSLFFAILCVVDLFGVFPIVALPKSIISCGLYGAPLVMFIITLQIYTAVVLGRCWVIAEKLDPSIVDKNRYPYAAIAHLTYGPKASLFITILLDVTVFGCGIPNLLVASQNLQLLGLRLTDGDFDVSFCLWLLVVGVLLCPIMWLGSPKNMKVLASVSVIVCTSVAVLTSFCILNDTDWENTFGRFSNSNRTDANNDENYKPFFGIGVAFPPIINILSAYGIVAFQFDIHPMLLTIEVDMKEKRKIGKAVCIGILSTCCLSALTTTLAAYRYGQMTTSNVLEILPKSWMLYLVILLVTLQLCLSSAVGNSALFQHLEDICGAPTHFCYQRCLIRSGLVFLAVLIGELLPKFDLVMSLIGGTLNGTLIFIMPPLFYTKIMKMEEIYDKNERNKQQMERSSDDEIANTVETNMKKKYAKYGALYTSFPSKSIDYKLLGVKEKKSQILKNWFKSLWFKFQSDCILSLAVVVFGIGATLASTYYNVFQMDNFKNLWSPCLSNLSYSFQFSNS